VSLFLLAVVLDLNGSSVAMVGRFTDDPDIVAGTPQPIRSDEAIVSTPALVGNVRRGLPVTTRIGLTDTYLPATGVGIPSKHWTEVFKPRDWAFFVLPLPRAFAWFWWFPLLTGLIGAYGLLLVVSRHVTTSVTLAVLLGASPHTAWWSQVPASVLGFLAGAAACVLVGLRAPSFLRAALWGIAAAYLTMAAFLVLYPPWQVSVGLVCAGLVAGLAIDERHRLRRLAAVLAVTLALSFVAVGVWLTSSGDAIRATASTIYPGHRMSEAGGGVAAWFFATPSTLWTDGSGSPLPLGVSEAVDGRPAYTNASELASAWFPLPLALACGVVVLLSALRVSRGAGPRVSGPRDPTWRGTGAVAASSVVLVTLLLLGWALVPQAGVLGLAMLTRVPGYRATLALGLASALLVALTVRVVKESGIPRAGAWLLWAGALGSAALMLWGTLAAGWVRGRPDWAEVAGVALVLCLGLAALVVWAHKRVAGLLAGAVVIALTSACYGLVNPLYRGLGPLGNDPLVSRLDAERRAGAQTAVVFGEDTRVAALATASGLEMVSGVTVYPQKQVWQRLGVTDPNLWNNYAKYLWKAVPGQDVPVRVVVVQGTLRRMLVDPCSGPVRALDIDIAVTATPIDAPCLVPQGRVRGVRGVILLYRFR
jgi:hypothetical protein